MRIYIVRSVLKICRRRKNGVASAVGHTIVVFLLPLTAMKTLSVAIKLNLICVQTVWNLFIFYGMIPELKRGECGFSEACLGILGIQDINFNFQGPWNVYYPSYFQGYEILCSIFLFIRKIKYGGIKRIWDTCLFYFKWTWGTCLFISGDTAPT